MCMRVSMSRYHHNPYRQSSASYTPQQASRQQGQPRTATRASTQPPPPPPAPDPDDSTHAQTSRYLCKTTGSSSAHSTFPTARASPVMGGERARLATSAPASAFFQAPSIAANVDMGGPMTLALSATAATASAPDAEGYRALRASSSSLFDSLNSRHPSLTSPLHGPPLPRSRYSSDDLGLAGNTAGSLTSFSTPTRLFAAPLPSRQASLNVKLSGSATAVERQSLSDWFGAAGCDDPSTGSCLSSSSWSALNQPQLRGPARASETSPVLSTDNVATTLFIDGLPAPIENKWQLQPYVPPQGLVALRVKSSRGRNVGFAVYDSIPTAHEALSWFKQMLIIKEVVQTSTFGAPPAADSARQTEAPPVPESGGHFARPASAASECLRGSPAVSESLPLEYEEYLLTQRFPDQFAALLRKCTLLRAEWARGLETQHTPANVAAGMAAVSSPASSPFSHPPSPWTAAAAVARPPPPASITAPASHLGRETGRDSCDTYSHLSERARQASPQQSSPDQSTLPSSALSPGFQMLQQPLHPCGPMGWPDAQSPQSLALYHAPLPATRRAWTAPAPSVPLQRPEPRYHGCGCGTAATVYHQDDQLAAFRPPAAAHSSSRVAERNDARDQADPWQSAPPPPAVLYREDEPLPQHRHASHHHHHQSPREPPLPSRTLFVRLIHNFDAPEYLQEDQMHSNPSFQTVRLPPAVAGTVTASGATAPCNEATALPTSTRFLSEGTPSSHGSPPSAVMPVSGTASTRLPASVVPHHHHHMHYRSPPSPTLVAAPQLRSSLDSRAAQACSPMQPPLPSQPTSPYDDRPGGGGGAADGMALQPTPTEEDREFFRFAQSVLREEYFSEKFAGFVKYREFLRPPYYGGCFVLFERGEDMQRCLQWMRKDERLMKLFAVAPARNDSFGP
ncbi:hypothetical protein LSCM1_06611 [Leishmania martiniquensis]|uniref:RRM domain-containing protein n=1 Tax=Leishmania martiniquensis TaxID=1580590 RepID=A0A836HIJ2_9TRYP|nr:hypothetical protein LSCM1_06611 [Leishmania martiniquensis]